MNYVLQYNYRATFVTLTAIPRIICNFSGTRSNYRFYARTGNTASRLFDLSGRLIFALRIMGYCGERREETRDTRERKNRERIVRKARGDAARPVSRRERRRRRRGERPKRKRPPDTEMAQCPAGYAESAIVLAGLPFPRLYGQRAEFAAIPYM